ncbi:two-component sensor histidine kinase [Streptomyces sp. Ru73]|uniref:sensor histidine kinase n=1 Tax=Streptomyces sp. Ru73 TaxID=2080748 RepID=UPI000CDCE786|nr:histidine kinase [Streptomyces sp. Ru73]POX42157.1 two-component sensor histidine kinase [Streptomyces sp. Ru73]
MLVSGVLEAARRDLFARPFAFRPLAPLDRARVAGWAPWLPPRPAGYLRWLPHALVLGYAFVLLMFGIQVATVGPPPAVLVFAVLVAGPPAMTLVRPVGAFWVSLLAMCVGALGDGGSGAWIFSFMGHLATMTLVVLRTRPRTALEMWAVTFVVLMPGTMIFGSDGWMLPRAAVASAVVLLAAAAVRAWREERQQVEETRTVTAVERSRRTTLEERATIARELHDVVAHHMSVIAIQAEAAPYRVKDTPPELATAFSTIRENAVAALTELRRILGVVRSEDPDAFAGPEAPQPTLADLDALLESVRGAGLSVTSVVTGAVRPLPQGVELSAYRIVQEALSNALRHAPGAEARVEVAYVLGGLGLRIVNGPANRLAKPSPGAGHGVLGMRERVGMLNGDMTNGPTPDGGYEVAVFLPAPSLPNPSDAAAARETPATPSSPVVQPSGAADHTDPTVSLRKPGTSPERPQE